MVIPRRNPGLRSIQRMQDHNRRAEFGAVASGSPRLSRNRDSSPAEERPARWAFSTSGQAAFLVCGAELGERLVCRAESIESPFVQRVPTVRNVGFVNWQQAERDGRSQRPASRVVDRSAIQRVFWLSSFCCLFTFSPLHRRGPKQCWIAEQSTTLARRSLPDRLRCRNHAEPGGHTFKSAASCRIRFPASHFPVSPCDERRTLASQGTWQQPQFNKCNEPRVAMPCRPGGRNIGRDELAGRPASFSHSHRAGQIP